MKEGSSTSFLSEPFEGSLVVDLRMVGVVLDVRSRIVVEGTVHVWIFKEENQPFDPVSDSEVFVVGLGDLVADLTGLLIDVRMIELAGVLHPGQGARVGEILGDFNDDVEGDAPEGTLALGLGSGTLRVIQRW